MNANEPGMSRLLRATLLIAMVPPALTFVTLPPALPLVAQDFSDGRAVAQGAQALSFAGGALGGLLAGLVIGWLGLRRSLRAMALTFAAAGGVAMTSTIPQTLLIGTFLVGFAGAVLSAGLAMATGAELAGEPRASMLGYQAATSDVSGIVVGLAAGMLATIVGWRGALGVYLLFGLIVFVLVVTARPRQLAAPDQHGGNGFLAALRRAGPLYLAAILMSSLMATQQLQLPFHLEENGIRSSADRAIVQTATTFTMALASLTFGFTRTRFGERRLLIAAGCSAAIGFIGMGMWSGGLGSAALAAAAIGLPVGLSVPLLFTAILREVPAHQHGYGIGLLNTAIFLGAAVNPLTLGGLEAAIGTSGMFLLCAPVALLAALGIAWRAGGRPARVAAC